MNTTEPLEISAEVTPNPNTLKFNVNRSLVESGSLSYTDPARAKESFLAEKLFGIENVIGVLAGRDFVTVTKSPSAPWQPLVEPITKTLREVLESGKALFPQNGAAAQPAAAPSSGGTSDIETKIKQILDNEIRPAVAMDGGDITFYGYKDGVVTLRLQGSCSSCPSSIMTLKMGVENRLKALIPEVKEVVQVT